MVGVVGETGTKGGGTLCYQHYHPTTVDSEEPVAIPEECGGWECTHQRVGPEAVSQHHPLAEGLVLVILLRKLCWPVNAKASAIHCSCAPVGDEGRCRM